MKPLKTLIVEDDPLIAEDLSGMLQDLGHKTIGKAFNAESALLKIKNLQPDLVLLDIELSGEMSGIEVADILNATYRIPFIYITSYYDDDTVAKAKKTNPSGYILKPFDENDLKVALVLAFTSTNHNHEVEGKLYIRVGGKLEPLNIASIDYIHADDNYCELYSDGKKHVVHQTLKELKKRLTGHGFLQCHRSYLIQLQHIQCIAEDHAFMRTNKVPIGKTYRSQLLEHLQII